MIPCPSLFATRRMAAVGATAPFRDRTIQPADGNPALRWNELASKETEHRESPLPSAATRSLGKGPLIGQKLPLKRKDVWTIRVRLQIEGCKRDLAMFNLLQILMEPDAEGLIGAGRHERSAERLSYHNGYRDHSLETRLGTLSLPIPKLRQGRTSRPSWSRARPPKTPKRP